MSGPDALPADVYAAIQAAARRDVADAPPLKDWQTQIMRPLCATRRKPTARRRAA